MNIKQILKKIEPFIAIGIFIMLVLLVIGLTNHVKLQEQIKENCGYSTNTYYCICYDSDSPEALLDSYNKNKKFNLTEWDLENS